MTPDGADETNIAEAVAGAEPERSDGERDTSASWASIRPSELRIDAEGADDEGDDPGLDEDGSVPAAALMGGSDSEFAADAEDEHRQEQEQTHHVDASGVARPTTPSAGGRFANRIMSTPTPTRR